MGLLDNNNGTSYRNQQSPRVQRIIMEKSIILITGGKIISPLSAKNQKRTTISVRDTNWLIANSGIGFELAAQLLSDSSKHVLLGSRSLEKGEAAIKELQSRNPAGVVELIQVDVSDQDSIAAAAKHIENTHGR